MASEGTIQLNLPLLPFQITSGVAWTLDCSLGWYLLTCARHLTVDQEILIRKLESYGLKDIELDWFRNYLTDRKQLVSFGKEISDPCLITLGVPQGSILGPLLFVLFVNDLPIDVERCQILMYADDTVMYFTASNAQEISSTLTSELDKVNDWLVTTVFLFTKAKQQQ